VYATATGANRMVVLDEDAGQQLGQAPTGAYPDGLAYDPDHHPIWTTNETGGPEAVIDINTNQVRGTVPLGGEAGNVAYDPTSRQMLVDVQSRNELAVIDPATLAVTRRMPLPGCDHDHGLALDPAHRLAFVACDANATLLSVDLDTWQILDTQRVGDDPNVLAYDPGAGRLYVAAESGWLTILDQHGRATDHRRPRPPRRQRPRRRRRPGHPPQLLPRPPRTRRPTGPHVLRLPPLTPNHARAARPGQTYPALRHRLVRAHEPTRPPGRLRQTCC
jgi:DNA-binding beta-propeller fold protein YncE